MSLLVNTHCRCSTELVVVHGGVTHCKHCDKPCIQPGACDKCAHLNQTCNDCRTHYPTTTQRMKCEQRHSA